MNAYLDIECHLRIIPTYLYLRIDQFILSTYLFVLLRSESGIRSVR